MKCLLMVLKRFSIKLPACRFCAARPEEGPGPRQHLGHVECSHEAGGAAHDAGQVHYAGRHGADAPHHVGDRALSDLGDGRRNLVISVF